jgi:hypothetical protein
MVLYCSEINKLYIVLVICVVSEMYTVLLVRQTQLQYRYTSFYMTHN